MKFARGVFFVAAVYGILVLGPGLFVEFTGDHTAAKVLPEFYYGFFASALVWQFAFLVIQTDPQRYRPLILVSVFEKLAFFGPCLVLYATGRLAFGSVFIGSLIDGVWMVLFFLAWRSTRPVKSAGDAS